MTTLTNEQKRQAMIIGGLTIMSLAVLGTPVHKAWFVGGALLTLIGSEWSGQGLQGISSGDIDNLVGPKGDLVIP